MQLYQSVGGGQCLASGTADGARGDPAVSSVPGDGGDGRRDETTTAATGAAEIGRRGSYGTTEVTTMTTTNSSKLYPFETKAQIAAKLAGSDEAVKTAIVRLWTEQTKHEQETKTTEVKNRRGFMSSHAVNGSKLAEKIQSGAELSAEEMDKARAMACRYTRQLAVFSREDALAANPELRATAAIFGV